MLSVSLTGRGNISANVSGVQHHSAAGEGESTTTANSQQQLHTTMSKLNHHKPIPTSPG